MKIKELKGKLSAMNAAELDNKLRESREELFRLRFQLATGHLEDTSKLRQLRKTIARVETRLRAEGREPSHAGTRDTKS